MGSRLDLKPDLAACELEGRILPAYTPGVPGLILTMGGYLVFGVPPGLNSSLNTNSSGSPGGGGSSGGGGNLPSSFNVSGFGLSSLQIGNSTGFPALNAIGPPGKRFEPAGRRRGWRRWWRREFGNNGNAGTTSNLGGYSSSFSSGFSFALNPTNNFGMTAATLGSVPVHSYGGGGGIEDQLPPETPPLEINNNGRRRHARPQFPGSNVRDPFANLGPACLARSRAA